MDSETTRTLITSISSVITAVGGILVVQLFTYLGSQKNNKKSKNESVHQQQYTQLFAPIHQIIFFTRAKDDVKLKAINSILFDHYELVPNEMQAEFNKCIDNKKLMTSFISLISSCHKMLQNELGYANLKMEKAEIKNAKEIIAPKKEIFEIDLKFHKIFTKLILTTCVLLYLLLCLFKILQIYYGNEFFEYLYTSFPGIANLLSKGDGLFFYIFLLLVMLLSEVLIAQLKHRE